MGAALLAVLPGDKVLHQFVPPCCWRRRRRSGSLAAARCGQAAALGALLLPLWSIDMPAADCG